jgi:outer membrane protein assembly factor BamB
MKKTVVFTLTLMLIVSAFAQKEFTKLYEIKCPISIDSWYSRSDQGLIIAGNPSAIWAMNGVTGKELWQVEHKSLFDIKKCEEWEYVEELAAIKLELKAEKKGDRKIVYLDEATGTIIQEDIKSRKPSASYPKLKKRKVKKEWIGMETLYLEDRDIELQLSYESPKFNSSFKRDKKFPISVSCSGKYHWTKQIQGNFLRSICDNGGTFSLRFGDFITIHAEGDYVFVIYEGVSVLDIKTGKLLWETTYEYASFDFGLAKHEMIIGRAPIPVSDGTGVYIADLSKDSRAIKKFDVATGNLLWKSERLDKDAIITEMMIINGSLAVRNGGAVTKQELIMDLNTGQYKECRTSVENEGDFSLNVYEANTGKLLWEGKKQKSLGDKFKNISNFLSDGTSLYVSSNNNLFSIDPKTGTANMQWDVAKMKIGDVNAISFYNGDILVHGEKGLARVNKTDPNPKYATITDKNLGEFFEGEVFYVYTGEKPEKRNEFIRLNIETGAVEGKIKDTPSPYFTFDGNEFIKKKDQVFYRFKTN